MFHMKWVLYSKSSEKQIEIKAVFLLIFFPSSEPLTDGSLSQWVELNQDLDQVTILKL